MASVLVIDDDALVSTTVLAYLRAAGHEGRHAVDARDGERLWRTWTPDVVVLDVVLPGPSGLDLLRRMRRAADPTRVVLLSGLGSTDDRIAGLEVGADDYLVKPFSPRELVLRVEALLRRAPVDQPGTQAPVVVGPLRVDPSTRSASVAGRVLSLTPREHDLLAFLARNAGRAFSARELLRRVWGWEFGDDSTVAVHVRRLREKLEPDPSRPALLATVRGAGYRLGTGPELDVLLEATGRSRGAGPAVAGP